MTDVTWFTTSLNQKFKPTKVYFHLEVFWTTLIVICNVTTIVALRIHRRVRNSTGHFVTSLCVANLLYGMAAVYRTIYFESYAYLRKYWMCCVVHYTMLLFPAYAILLNLIAMTVDRYIAVIYPLRYPKLMVHSTVTKVIVGIWTFSVVLGWLPLLWNSYNFGKKEVASCTFLGTIPPLYVMLFFAPLILGMVSTVMYVYYKIWKIRHRHLRRIFVLGGENIQVPLKEMKTTLTVGLIVISCGFILLPFTLVLVLKIFEVQFRDYGLLYSVTFELTFVNPILTPVIYVWRSGSFVKVLKSVVCVEIRKRTTARPVRRTNSMEITMTNTTCLTSI